MKLSRDTIQRMVEGSTGSSGSGSGVIGVTEQRVMEILQDYETIEALETTLQSYVTNNALTQTLQSYVTNTALNTTLQDYVTNTSLATTLASYATKEWVDDNYLSLSFFNALFEARTSEGEAVAPNDGDTSTIESIKAMFGFWTDQYVSALGQSPDGGSGSGSSRITPVDMDLLTPSSTFAAGDAIAFNGVIYRATGATDNFPIPLVVSGNNFVVNEYKGYKAYVRGSEVIQDGWQVWLDTGLNYWIEKHEDRISQAERDIQILYSMGGGGSGGGSVDPDVMWELLAAGSSEQINTTHLTSALSPYASKDYISAQGFATQAWVSANFNNYSLPLASSSTRGGVKTGFTTDAANRSYAIQLSSEKMYVNVPWTDTNTWRPVQDNLTSTSTTDSLSAKQGYLLANGSARDNTKLPLSGGTMTGKLNLLANQYDYVTNSNSYGLGCNNSDIVGVNGIFTNDLSDSWSEGLNFARSNGNWDTIRAADGTFYLEYNSGTQMAYFNINGLYLKNGWLRTYGSTGWYNESHGGGWYMEDDTWIRSYNSKYVWINTYLCAQHISAGTSSTNSNYALYVSGTGYFSTGVYSAGYVTALSDKRHKDIESEIDLTAKDIAAMPAVKFRWNDRNDAALHAGTIAQEWQNILPEVVSEGEDPDKTLSMDYGVAALVATIITARQVMDHERRICELEKENAALKKELEYIKHQ